MKRVRKAAALPTHPPDPSDERPTREEFNAALARPAHLRTREETDIISRGAQWAIKKEIWLDSQQSREDHDERMSSANSTKVAGFYEFERDAKIGRPQRDKQSERASGERASQDALTAVLTRILRTHPTYDYVDVLDALRAMAADGEKNGIARVDPAARTVTWYDARNDGESTQTGFDAIKSRLTEIRKRLKKKRR